MEDVEVMEVQDMEVQDMEVQDMEEIGLMDNMGAVMLMAINMAVIVITRIIAQGNAVKLGGHSSTHKASSLTAASMGTRSTTGRPQNLQNVTVPTGKKDIVYQ